MAKLNNIIHYVKPEDRLESKITAGLDSVI